MPRRTAPCRLPGTMWVAARRRLPAGMTAAAMGFTALREQEHAGQEARVLCARSIRERGWG